MGVWEAKHPVCISGAKIIMKTKEELTIKGGVKTTVKILQDITVAQDIQSRVCFTTQAFILNFDFIFFLIFTMFFWEQRKLRSWYDQVQKGKETIHENSQANKHFDL